MVLLRLQRFVSYAPWGVLILHLVLLGLCVVSLRRERGSSPLRRSVVGGAVGGGEEDGEKMVELGEYEKMPKDKA